MACNERGWWSFFAGSALLSAGVTMCVKQDEMYKGIDWEHTRDDDFNKGPGLTINILLGCGVTCAVFVYLVIMYSYAQCTPVASSETNLENGEGESNERHPLLPSTG